MPEIAESVISREEEEDDFDLNDHHVSMTQKVDKI